MALRNALLLLAVLVPTLACSAPSGLLVEVDSLDAGVRLPGYWFPAVGAGGAAVVALHGCGGLQVHQGRLGEGQLRYARMLNDAGIAVLFTESFLPRGEKSICSQTPASRAITEEQRRLDVYGALAWLARQPGVGKGRLGVLGWSHGGQTVLASADRSRAVVAQAGVKPTALVAFYPGCSSIDKSATFAPVAPLLVMSGALDDWTPAAPCRRAMARLGARDGLPAVEYVEYAGSFHGFDSALPPRVRGDVGGTKSGKATVGGNPLAREQSAQAMLQFFTTHLMH